MNSVNPTTNRQRRAALGVTTLLALVAATIAIVQPAAAQRADDAAQRDECIFNRGIRDFEVLDDQNLILFGPGRRAYHIVLATPSLNVDHEIAIGIYDTDGRICSFGGDAIIVDGPIRERISIRRITSLNDAELEAIMVEFGKEEAADEDTVTVTEIE